MDIKENLIQALDNARQNMKSLVDAVEPDMELYPGWTMKHVIAHIIGWDETVIDSLKALQTGVEYTLPNFRGIDEYNAESVETRQELPYQHIYVEWGQVREQLKETIRAMSPEKFTVNHLFPWPQRGTVAQLIGVLIHHENAHADELRQIYNAKKSTEG